MSTFYTSGANIIMEVNGAVVIADGFTPEYAAYKAALLNHQHPKLRIFTICEDCVIVQNVAFVGGMTSSAMEQAGFRDYRNDNDLAWYAAYAQGDFDYYNAR